MPAKKNYDGINLSRPTSELMEELKLSKSRINSIKAKAGINSIKGRPKNKTKSIKLPTDVVNSFSSLAETLTAYYKNKNNNITINENIIACIILYNYFKNSNYVFSKDVIYSLENNQIIKDNFNICNAFYDLQDAIREENFAASEARKHYRNK